jgi:pimeloyl-ACP methyl ester carboxylesterase
VGKRKNIVLLHGWGASSAKLSDLSAELEKIGFNTFSPKLPGFELNNPKTPWSVDDYSKFVLSESDKLFGNDKYFLFGHSFGGRVTIKSANHKRVSGIILCATGGISRPKPLKRFVFIFFAKAGKSLLLIKPLAGYFRRVLYKLSREPDYGNTAGTMRDTFKRVVSEDLKKLIKNINKPMLVLWGDEDRMVNVSDAYKIKKLNPKSTLKIFENRGHRLPYELTKDLAKEIEVWSR